MDFFLSRFRNLTVLLIVIVAQLLVIAYQVKSNQDIPLIRVWAVTAVTPVEQALEVVRHYTWGFVEDYFVLLGVRSQNESLKNENGRLKMENHYLKAELSTADRARTLSVFQAHSPSATVAARVIGNGTGANSKVVFVDRGSASGVESGMAVVTPEGIVGKVVSAYPTASLVMLITDPTFAAGGISQKNRVHGTIKGQGHGECLVDYIQNEEPVEVGEWFFTSGDDRIFPKGFPVGRVSAARNGKTFKEIYITPTGMQGGVEEVLIILHAVHQEIPEGEIASPTYRILTPPSGGVTEAPQSTDSPTLTTDADRLRQMYQQAGQAQNHVFGEGLPGSKPPDFTKIPGIRAATPGTPAPATPAAPAQAASGSPTPSVSGNAAATGSNTAPNALPPVIKPAAPRVQATAPSATPQPRVITPPAATEPAERPANQPPTTLKPAPPGDGSRACARKSMTEYTEHLLTNSPRKDAAGHSRFLWLVVVPLIAVLSQVYIPRFVPFLAYLELPLLITVHFALSRGTPIAGLLYGMFIGLVQDSLSHQPIGMFGIVKTLVGYFAATVSVRFEVENPVVTFILSFFFYFFHQFFYWVLSRALLGEAITFDAPQTLVFGFLNAAVALPLFRILDKLKVAQ